jgi:Bacteriophage tail sheath protein
VPASSSIAPLVLGAPGIYRAPDNPIRALTGVRMDVCAFVGVAPRGPARVPYFDRPWAPQPRLRGERVRLAIPIAVESWSAYTQLFGSFEGPGRLPYAVASFFDNGGRRAYVVRIVHRYVRADGTPDDTLNDAGVSRGCFVGLTGTGGRRVCVRARNEGSWGRALRARLSYTSRALALGPSDFFVNRVRVPSGLDIEAGTTLRLLLGASGKVIRRVASVIEDWNPLDGSRQKWAWFDAPTAVAAQSAELVEGLLAIDDGVGPTERHDRLGLAANHSRWLAAVLVNDSELLYPSDDPAKSPGDPLATWIDSDLDLDPSLPVARTSAFTDVADRYADIVPGDFFDSAWAAGDEKAADGVHAVVDLPDVSLVVAPDLYSPGPLAPIEAVVTPPTFAGPEFAECVAPTPPVAQEEPVDDLTGLQLDPEQDLDEIAALQRRLTDLADVLESFVVLLDVPPGLSQRRILYWRGKFDTAYAAAYYPWLNIVRTDDRRSGLVRVNPSAAAAGIIAHREHQFGVPYGPANAIAVDAVSVDDRVSPARHDELHQHAINVYVPERDGINLTAARTLSLAPIWRQLNVRRLVTMIRRVLERQMQWSVFEPNNQRLRFQVARMLEAFLRQLYRTNAFTGATEGEAFFVKCDDKLNPVPVEQAGQLIAQIGIAPAEPMEFIVIELAREGDTILTAEAI